MDWPKKKKPFWKHETQQNRVISTPLWSQLEIAVDVENELLAPLRNGKSANSRAFDPSTSRSFLYVSVYVLRASYVRALVPASYRVTAMPEKLSEHSML